VAPFARRRAPICVLRPLCARSSALKKCSKLRPAVPGLAQTFFADYLRLLRPPDAVNSSSNTPRGVFCLFVCESCLPIDKWAALLLRACQTCDASRRGPW
jgi:hypothetical protein